MFERIAQQEVLAKAVDLDRPGVKILGYRRIIHPELSRGGRAGCASPAADRLYLNPITWPHNRHVTLRSCRVVMPSRTDSITR